MYIKYNENGEYGFYNIEIHGEEFCLNECIKISGELYNFLLKNQGKYLVDVESVLDKVTENNLIKRPVKNIERDTSQEERIEALEQAMLEIVMGGM